MLVSAISSPAAVIVLTAIVFPGAPGMADAENSMGDVAPNLARHDD